MNATQVNPSKQAPVCSRGFSALPCPRCGEMEARISLSLEDVSADNALKCWSCEEEFSLDLIRGILARWGKVVVWIDSAPALEE